MTGNTVGMVGLGFMGSAMSANLVRAGFKVIGYDVDAERSREFEKDGGTAAPSCQEVAKRSTILLTSLSTVKALLETVEALEEAAQSGSIVIETSTLPIAAKEEARERLASRAVTLLDCPVSGGTRARAGNVVVYASGDREAYARVAGVLDAFSRAHYFVGEFGMGSKMKFVANLLVAIHNVAAAEAMVLAMKAGLDPNMVLQAVGDGSGSSSMLQARGPRMVAGDYSNASMRVEIWQKDMTIIGDFARKLECPTPLFLTCASIYTAAMAMGRRSEDTASVCAVLEKMANFRRPAQWQSETAIG